MVSLPVLMISAVLMIAGSSILTVAIFENPYLPLGNIIAWAGIMALPTTIYFGINNLHKPTNYFERLIKYLLLSSIILAVFWAPVSYWLSGNFAFNFTYQPGFRGNHLASKIFWSFSYFIVATPVVVLIFYGLIKMITVKNRKRDKK